MSLVIALLPLIGIIGCGGDSTAVKVAPISGVVNLDGSPLADAVLTFHPEEGPTGVGMGNDQGEFKIKTNGQNGAPVGKCKVTVTTASDAAGVIPEMDGNEGAIVEKTKLNSKYASPETTDLIIDVTEEGNTNLSLDLDT